MWIKKEYDFYDLLDNCYGSAKDVLQMISDADLEDDFMELLDEIFPDNEDNPPSITDVNDLLWFDSNSVLDTLGIFEDEEDE